MASQILSSALLTKVLLVLGLAVTTAASHRLFIDAKDDNCKKAGQLNSTGLLACDSDLPCTPTGASCQPTKWHARVQDPFVRYCSCTANPDVGGVDPETLGLCMAYSVDLAGGGGQVGHCTSAGCAAGTTCSKEAAGAWKKCICQ